MTEQRPVLEESSLYPVFQPILDIRQQQAIGYEALIRSYTGAPPPQLFAEARAAGRQLAFDRQCRELALREFAELPSRRSNKLLFLNVDVSALDDADSIEGWISEQVRASGLNQRQVALEIVEANVESTEKLIDFVERYRAAGFLIVLDDFGESHSNLNRVVHIKPDIIKVDKALIRGIDEDYYKQSIVQTITRLSNKIGAMTLAEGIETQEELFACYALGIQLFQGYFFAKPQRMEELAGSGCVSRLKETLPELNARIETRVQAVRDCYRSYEAVSNEVIAHLCDLRGEESVEACFYDVIERQPEIDCLYLLDAEGLQISDTVCRTCAGNMHVLFAPSCRGADHAFKEYYYYLKFLGNERYISEPYISLATGNLCRTIATRFEHEGEGRVLCIDFLYANG